MASIDMCGMYESSISNGVGIRLTIFVPGCRHSCVNCHNIKYKNKDSGYREDVKSIFSKMKDPLIDGITISGGDPLDFKREGLVDILKEAKRLDLSVWMYTGYTYEEVSSRKELDYVDILVDGEYREDLKGEFKYRGSSNQRVIDVKETRLKNKVVEVKL